MAFKNVTSSDPRKAEAVAWIKAASGARKVTMLHEDTERRYFVGHALNPGTGERFGWWAVAYLTGEVVARYETFEDLKAAREGK